MPLAADDQNIALAKGWIARQRAHGGTELEPALRAALTAPAGTSHVRTVILITHRMASVRHADRIYVLSQGAG